MENKKFTTITLKIREDYKQYLKALVKENNNYSHLSLSSFVRMCVNQRIEQIINEENK